MRRINLLSPGVCSNNAADRFLTKVVYDSLSHIGHITEVSTHNLVDSLALNRIQAASINIVCGSGILETRKHELKSQWPSVEMFEEYPTTGIGIGGDGVTFNLEVAKRYAAVFSGKVVGCRDRYTAACFKQAGVNAKFTGCHTLSFTPFEKSRSDTCIFAVNCYKPDNYDEYLKILRRNYRTVIGYAQHPDDCRILSRLGLEVLQSTSFEYLLDYANKHSADFIGARLHAAAMLLRNNIYAIPIATDERGRIYSDLDLPVVNNSNCLFEIMRSYSQHFSPGPVDMNFTQWVEANEIL